MTTVEDTATRIKEIRQTMRRLYGDRWPEFSAPYRNIIEDAMRTSGETNVFGAVIHLAQELKRRGSSPLALLVLFATAGDMASSANAEAHGRRGSDVP